MRITTEQVAEALSLSICELLAKRLRDVPESGFQRVLATNEDMATVRRWLGKACDLFEGVAWRDAKEGWEGNLDGFRRAARSHGMVWDEGAATRAEEGIRRSVARDHEPLRDVGNLYIRGINGSYERLAEAWAGALQEAASKPDALRAAWVEAYVGGVVADGVRVSVER